MDFPSSIPPAITLLLVSYFCHTLNEVGRHRLDEWICESEENMRLFEECVEMSLLPVQYDIDRMEELEDLHAINLN